MSNFEQVLQAQVKNVGTNAAFPVTMGVNAFRGFLDEFMKESKEIKRKEKKEKKVEAKTVKKERQKKDMLLVSLFSCSSAKGLIRTCNCHYLTLLSDITKVLFSLKKINLKFSIKIV